MNGPAPGCANYRSIEKLVVGEKCEGDLHFVGSVKNEKCPFVNLPEKKGAHRMDREKMKTVQWIRPRIVAEIVFNERTHAGHLRHSKFLRLRERADVRVKSTNPNRC